MGLMWQDRKYQCFTCKDKHCFVDFVFIFCNIIHRSSNTLFLDLAHCGGWSVYMPPDFSVQILGGGEWMAAYCCSWINGVGADTESSEMVPCI